MNQELQRAITAGVVVQAQGGHRCRVCNKDVTEIGPHLRGKDHFNNLAWEAISNPAPHPFLLDGLPPVVREAKKRSELEPGEKIRFSYRCLVCPKRPVSDGIRSLEAHLKGKDHEKAKTQQPNAPLRPAGVPLKAKGYDSELQRALTAGVVVEVPRAGGPPSFKCCACDMDFTGSAPCSEHLRSNNHKKKIEVVEEDGLKSAVAMVAKAIGGGRPDPVVGSGEFRWRVLTRTKPFPPSKFVYRNLSDPRGLVLIFNYFTGQGDNERQGAKRDSFNLNTLFKLMGYQVYLYEDYSKSKTEEVLTSTQDNPFLRNIDSFIVFILSHGSHGKDGQIFFTTSLNDKDSIKLDDVRYKFTDIACPSLRDKPKLFFVNFCRTRAADPSTAYDGTSSQSPGPKDMMTLYSCIDSFKSPPDLQNGTFFVQAWCEVLAAHAHNQELRDLHQRACQRLMNMRGSVPELQDYFFKKFYFNPVNTH